MITYMASDEACRLWEAYLLLPPDEAGVAGYACGGGGGGGGAVRAAGAEDYKIFCSYIQSVKLMSYIYVTSDSHSRRGTGFMTGAEICQLGVAAAAAYPVGCLGGGGGGGGGVVVVVRYGLLVRGLGRGRLVVASTLRLLCTSR